MPTGQGDTFQESFPGQPYQDQKESVPCIEQDMQGLPASGRLFGQGERETVLGHLLSRIIRAVHPKGRKPTGPVHEGQTPEYRGTRVRHTYAVHGPAKDKYDRTRTGQQGNAPLGHRLQPEEVPEIRGETVEERGGTASFGGIGEKDLSIAFPGFYRVWKFGL